MEFDFEKFSTRIKQLRIEKGAKQTDLAAILDCTYQHYQKIEYGKINIPTSTLLTLADYYGVSADYLLGRSDNRTSSNDESILTVILPENEHSAKLSAILQPRSRVHR